MRVTQERRIKRYFHVLYGCHKKYGGIEEAVPQKPEQPNEHAFSLWAFLKPN